MTYSTATASSVFHAPQATRAATIAVATSPFNSSTPALKPAASITPQARIPTEPRMSVMGHTVTDWYGEVERFFARADVTGDCWEWQLTRDKNGYGKYKRFNRTHRAHRFAWELMIGLIPEGFVIDHLCKNTACVNPDHLEPVTWAENLHRGESIQAHFARNKLCPRGHEYKHTQSGGYRKCRECANLKRRERRAKARSEGRTSG